MFNQYKHTITNCSFDSYISSAHDRYYNTPTDANMNTQVDMTFGVVVAIFERSLTSMINGFSFPASLPWHQVEEVYIHVNYDGEFHWVLLLWS